MSFSESLKRWHQRLERWDLVEWAVFLGSCVGWFTLLVLLFGCGEPLRPPTELCHATVGDHVVLLPCSCLGGDADRPEPPNREAPPPSAGGPSRAE